MGNTNIDVTDIAVIIQHLKCSTFGMSISAISRATGFNRNTVSKYLQILMVRGEVEKRIVGQAHIYLAVQRVPVSIPYLDANSEPICIVSSSGILLWINAAMKNILVMTKRYRTGTPVQKPFTACGIPLFEMIARLPAYTDGMTGKNTYLGKWSYIDEENGKKHRVVITPTVYYDGTSAVCILIESFGRF